MIPTIVKLPLSLAQHLAGGILRASVGVASSVLHRLLPGEGAADDRGGADRSPSSPTPVVDIAPARANPATRDTAKKPAAGATKAKKAVAKKSPTPKAKPTKPASVLDEPAAPVDDDPIVYSTGPE